LAFWNGSLLAGLKKISPALFGFLGISIAIDYCAETVALPAIDRLVMFTLAAFHDYRPFVEFRFHYIALSNMHQHKLQTLYPIA
jgi:hypothetical protein